MSNRIQFRRDTRARWAEINPVLMEGEVGLEIDTQNIKMGDGTHAWNDLEYGIGYSNVTNEPGNNENLAASQKLVTAELGKKFDKTSVVQEPGNSEELVMSQKAVSDKLKGLSTEQEIIYDVSARNNGVVFESLSALLSSSDLSTLIPMSVRCGGMSIRFIQSDNKYGQYRLMTTSFSTIESDWLKYGTNETIVQSTDDYTLTDLVWTDTGVRGLKNSSDFWLNSGDKLNFSYTASYGGIIQQKKSDGTYVSLFSTNDVQNLTAFEFICQVGGYYRFHVNFTQGKVISVSLPRMNVGNGTMPMMPTSSPTTMLVDVTIEADGRTATYSIPENLAVTYAGSTVLSTDREGISREIEAMRATAEQILSSVDRQKEILDKTQSLLAELNPAYKEKKETDERFNRIEGDMSEMKSMVRDLLNKLK